MTSDTFEARVAQAVAERQAYEELVRLAHSRQRPVDYQAAMNAAIKYAATMESIVVQWAANRVK